MKMIGTPRGQDPRSPRFAATKSDYAARPKTMLERYPTA